MLLVWTAFTTVMYSFPYTMPVEAGTMNYVSAVYGVVGIIVIGYWFARGKRTFRSKREREEEVPAVMDGLVHS